MHNYKKALAISLFFFVLLMAGIPQVFAQDVPSDTTEKVKNVQLTETQKKELAGLHQEILAKKKELITKYVKYGVMSEEKGKKIISRLEKRYEKLEQNGFIPHWDKSKKRGFQ
ncbi:MAG: YckD family protein [Peptococcaceae bacterium]